VRDEVPDELRNVRRPFPKRRQVDREHVQPVEQVGAELPRLHQLLERAVRRRDDPDVGPDHLRAPDALERLLLEHAQELRLEVERQVADLVQEERAVVGELEAPDPSRDGARERAPLVSEQLALEEPGGDGGAVELDERTAPPPLSR
jgi:hypothetical protein